MNLLKSPPPTPRIPLLLAVAFAFAATPAIASASDWIAFNDCVDTDPDTTPPNATSFGLGRSYQGDGISGNLLDFATGEDTGVTVTFVENFSNGNSINWATDFADYTAGSDADLIFGGRLNLAGNMSYNDGPGWSLDLQFSNLDPSQKYTFAATVNRNGGPDYANRISNWTISGVGSASYASSSGAHKVDEQSVEFSTGENQAGFVARWTDIEPGADGAFTIRTTHGVGVAKGGLLSPDEYRGYAGGIFMLEAQSAAAGIPFSITSITYDETGKSANLSWESSAGSIYVVEASSDLAGWEEISEELTATSVRTAYVENDIAEGTARRYYRVRKR